MGIDSKTDFTIKPWMEEHLGGRQLGDNEIILGSNAHVFMGKSESQAGDVEHFYGQQFTVVGILDSTGIGIDDSGFVTIESVYEMARQSDYRAVKKLEIKEGDISALMVKVDPGADRGDVASQIEVDISGVAVVTSRELMSSSIARQLESLTPGLLLIGAGFWLIAVLMIGALFSMVVNERRRELGLLQAMGATRSFIFRLVMLEAVQLTAIGGAAGLAVGAAAMLIVKGPIAGSLGIEYLWPGAAFIASFALGYMVLAVVTGILAALYPAFVASRLEPYQAIRTGE